jgi:hypothetical protein
MPRLRKPASPFRYFNSSPEVIRLGRADVCTLSAKREKRRRPAARARIDICHETVRLHSGALTLVPKAVVGSGDTSRPDLGRDLLGRYRLVAGGQMGGLGR